MVLVEAHGVAADTSMLTGESVPEALGEGDRAFADDNAIVGGLARIDGRPVMVIGHEKGRDTKAKVRRNFGMPKPEGYRKALRLMHMAERFGLPILTFIDTAGAWPGIDAEERGQSEAIARNLLEMAEVARSPSASATAP